MNWFFNPNDWFSRHPVACLVAIALLTLLAGAV